MANEQAIKNFELNLKPLLMEAPLKGKRILGFDPGYRMGCKVAVVDETGRVLDTAADRYRFTALFYEILSRLVEESRPEYRPSGALRRLDPAVEWLKNNLFDPQLRVGELHRLCGMSDAYFRRLFLTRFGVTPKKYVLTHRLSHARAILRSGEYNSIAEVAALSGFDDALYFSKAYRAAYGAPPSRETEEMA